MNFFKGLMVLFIILTAMFIISCDSGSTKFNGKVFLIGLNENNISNKDILFTDKYYDLDSSSYLFLKTIGKIQYVYVNNEKIISELDAKKIPLFSNDGEIKYWISKDRKNLFERNNILFDSSIVNDLGLSDCIILNTSFPESGYFSIRKGDLYYLVSVKEPYNNWIKLSGKYLGYFENNNKINVLVEEINDKNTYLKLYIDDDGFSDPIKSIKIGSEAYSYSYIHNSLSDGRILLTKNTNKENHLFTKKKLIIVDVDKGSIEVLEVDHDSMKFKNPTFSLKKPKEIENIFFEEL